MLYVLSMKPTNTPPMALVPVANEHDMIAALVYLDPFLMHHVATSDTPEVSWAWWTHTPIDTRRSIVEAGSERYFLTH